MEILKVFALRGPNIWASFPVLEAWVDLKELKDSSSEEIPGFNSRLMAWLPGMIEHRCSVGQRGGFFERLRRGTYQAHILEHVTLELQSLAGSSVGFGRARESLGEGVYKVAVEYQEEQLARASLATARELCLAAIHDRPFDVVAEVDRLMEVNHRARLGPSTNSIVQAAVARGIPYRRLNEGSMVQFGQGFRQRRIMAAETDRTGAIAQEIAQDKELTRELLKTIGAPVPPGRPVSDAEDAWQAAQEIGGPVVVKPRYGNQGRGVATNLSTQAQVLAGYEAARQEGAAVVVERYVPGDDYRLLIVGGRLVAAARREPAQVVGDGRLSISELVARVNADPRRSDGHATSLSKIPLDAVSLGVLAEQGLTPDSVPAAGQKVLVRRNGNLSTGGTATDVTDLVHPELAGRVVEAARMIGLDIAGVDVLARDIGRPLEEQGGAIVEINAAPGLRMHLEPSAGPSRPVGEAIVDAMFGPGDNGRIPVVGVTGTNGKTTTTRLIAHLLATSGKCVGMACTDGVFIAGRRIDAGDCSGPQSARAVLLNPRVEAAVLETARGGILREGLGFDRCDVAVVTNIAGGDHLGLAGIDTPEDLARVKRTLVDAVAPQGAAVLKADDPLVAAMAARRPGCVIYFALCGDHAVMKSHREAGGRCACVRDGHVVLSTGASESVLMPLDRIPLVHRGRVAFQVENVLAAAAAGWALGMETDLLRRGLESFAANMTMAPGRFNLLKIGGATVIVDYGHNTSALVALVEAIEHFPHERRVAVYSAAGDRRDQDLIDQGRLLGQSFDRVILYEDHYKRGRADGEIIRLFGQGLSQGSRVKESQQVQGALKAVETALRGTQPGDLLLIQADVVDETVDFIKAYLQPHLNRRDAGHELGVIEVPRSPTAMPASEASTQLSWVARNTAEHASGSAAGIS